MLNLSFNHIENVAFILKDYSEATPELLQRILMVDFYTARDIFRELVKLGVLYDLHKDLSDEENFIARVNRNKIKEYLTN